MRFFSLRRIFRITTFWGAMLVLAVSCFAQSFKNPLIIPTSADLLALATSDLNHDGKPDLVYVDGQQFGQQVLHILLGRGNGTFSHGQDFVLPSGTCCGIALADTTGDGVLDIILPGAQQFTPQVSVLIGNGDGTFQSPLVSTFQEINISLFVRFNSTIGVGDVNGDGKIDLIANDAANGHVVVLLGDGSGKFVLGSEILARLTGSVYLTDLNGDHRPDLVVTDPLGNDFAVLLGNGDGTFQSLVRYTGGSGILADLDGDGHPDMVVENFPAQLGVFKGNADGTFALLSPLGSASSPNVLTAITDLNSDGFPDFIFVVPTGIGVKLDAGGLVFSPMKLTVSGSVSSNLTRGILVTGDFNGDGHPDIAMAVEGGIAILLGKGDGTFVSADFYDMGQLTGATAIAKFNGDNSPDIAVTLSAVFPRLLLGDGLGSFTLGPDPNPSYGSQTPVAGLLAGDFNGDGKMDVVTFVGSLGSSPNVFLGLGNGLFSAPIPVPIVIPVVADVNNDGRSDLVSVSGDMIVCELGQANGSFTEVRTMLLDSASNLVAVGDFNKDGHLDVITEANLELELWLGNGDGSFRFGGKLQNLGDWVTQNETAVVADLDGDGNLDLIFLPSASLSILLPFQPMTILYGNGDGTFQPAATIGISHTYTQVLLSDVNQDGKPDLILSDGVGIAVVLNLGGRKFGQEVHFVAGQSISTLSVRDVNGDGFPDIVAANPGGTTVVVLLNQPNGASLEGAATRGNLVFSPEPSTSGQPFAATLAVSGLTTGAAVPTGTVSILVDGGFIADVPLVGGTATYNFTQTLIPLVHTVIATYNGDITYAPASFAATHAVQPPVYATQTTITATPSAVLTSQTVHLVATVTGTPLPPAGSIVTFLDGATPIGTATIDGVGKAFRDTSLLAVGSHSLTAVYQGFTQLGFTNGPSYTAAIFSPSTSSPVTVNVTTNITTSTLLASNLTPTAGTVVTFSFKAASPAGVPFGGASFFDGSALLGTLGLNADGSANFSTASLSKGSHTITAAFNSNGPFAGSVSLPVAVSVSAAPPAALPTVVSLSETTNPSDGSQVLVANIGALEGSPAGIITFLDNGMILGTAETNPSGIATLSVKAPANGNHNMSASFAGASGYAPSVSPVVQDQWPATGPGFSLNAGARMLRLTPEGSDAVQLGIAGLGSFGQQVQLACAAGLPAGFVCEFSPGTLEGSGTSIFRLRSQTQTAAKKRETIPLWGITIGLVGVVLIGGKNRRSRSLVLAFVMCCASSVLIGCRTTTSVAAGPQMVVLTIEASSGTGPNEIVHSTQISLILPGSNQGPGGQPFFRP